jgi:glycosyltransferase involved in cell wall biosynthesis
MNNNDVLLSICIPTYNRAEYLKICLAAIIPQLGINDPIEVIVSDNLSSDNTLSVVSEFITHPKLILIKQAENVGPIKNGFGIIEKYAKGKYCWLVGDDDYIMPGAIQNILKLIKENIDVDFFYVDIENYELDKLNIPLEETLIHIKNKQTIIDLNYKKLANFEELLHPQYSDLFLGEIMASIFRKEIWLKEIQVHKYFDLEYLTTLETAYTHCVVFANQFIGKKAIYVSTPIILVDNRAREWSAKAHYIIVEHLLTLLKLYYTNGVRGTLYNACVKHYIRLTLPVIFRFIFFKKTQYRNKISYFKYFQFIIIHPFATIASVINILKKVISN